MREGTMEKYKQVVELNNAGTPLEDALRKVQMGAASYYSCKKLDKAPTKKKYNKKPKVITVAQETASPEQATMVIIKGDSKTVADILRSL